MCVIFIKLQKRKIQVHNMLFQDPLSLNSAHIPNVTSALEQKGMIYEVINAYFRCAEQ